MASSVIFHGFLPVSPQSPNWYKTQSLALTRTQFLSSNSLSGLRNLSLKTQIKKHGSRNSRPFPAIYAAQSEILRVIQTVWKVGKDGIEAGTNLVPDSIPRPVARISVTIAVLTVSLFVIKSFLSTAFFVLAMMGLIYFVFIALNKDEGPRGGGGPKGDVGAPSTEEESLEEARRIMEKYK